MKNIKNFSIHPVFKFIICSLLYCQITTTVQAQNENSRSGVLSNQMFDTRSLSMAGTTIADTYGKPSISVNSAISALFMKPSFTQFNANYNWESNLMQYSLTLPTVVNGANHFTARLGYVNAGDENSPFRDSSDFVGPDLQMFRAELAYAYKINKDFSFGLLQGISNTTTLDNEKHWNYFTNLGLAYAPDGPVSYGIALRGLGHQTTYVVQEDGETSLNNRLDTQILEVGLTVRYPIEERTYLSVSFSNEKRFGQDGVWYKGGIEISPLNFIQLRGGAMVNFDQTEFIPRIGLGINTRALRLDYMIAPNSMIGEKFHQLGITINL